MKKFICKSKTVKINDEITETYQLMRENGAYTIICIEKNLKSGSTSIEYATNITYCKRKARGLLEFLIKNGVCEGTVNDIIHDRMC
jgi:hypothetical protein